VVLKWHGLELLMKLKKVVPVMVAGEDQGYLSIINSIPIDSGPESKGPGLLLLEEKYIVVTTFRNLVWIHGKI
jgi:hypothetical protein